MAKPGTAGHVAGGVAAGNLVAAHPGNAHAAKHGAWSGTGRLLQPRAEEVAGAVMGLPHTHPIDAIGAEEIGQLVALCETIDAEIAKAGTRGRRMLPEHRLRASARLERWLKEYGATPASRAAWPEAVARGNLATEIAKRREAANGS